LVVCIIAFASGKSYPMPNIGSCDHWTYDEQDHWGDVKCTSTNMCATGTTQSPVLIQSWTEQSDLPRLVFSDYSSQTNVTCVNTGHNIRCAFTNGYYRNDGDDALHSFQAAQFHIHVGQEETVQGQDDKASVHVVHFQNPPPASDRIAVSVIGLLFRVGKTSTLLQPIISALPNLQNEDDSVIIAFEGFQSLFNTMHANNQDGYWNYPGSLTTPPCAEQIDWTVMETKFELDQQQLDALVQINLRIANSSKVPPLSTARPIQRTLNGVAFRKGGPSEATSGSSNGLRTSTIVLAVFVGLLFLLLLILGVYVSLSGAPKSQDASGNYSAL